VTVFTPYQKFVIGVLTFLQFSVVLDFMIMSPLGALLMPALSISTRQFGLVVSAYAVSAAVSGILTAGFADRFDRKRLLLFFYGGFILGTLLCGLAWSYRFLVTARVVTGMFGGVMNSIVLAIVADLFALEVRGRVLGFVQTAFAASQVLGLPLGLWLGNRLGWHAPFLVVVAVSAGAFLFIQAKLRPLTGHMGAQRDARPLRHLLVTIRQGRHLQAFSATMFLSLGGFMLMPFASAFSVQNLEVSLDQLPWVYLVTGIVSLAVGPFLGRLSDRIGKYRVFFLGSLVTIAMVLFYTRLGPTPLWAVIGVNVVLFCGINARLISSQALISAVPELADRGAFMSVNSAVAQLSGGVAAAVAGLIVTQSLGGSLERYDVLGRVVAGASVLTILLMVPIDRAVMRRSAAR
jgi:predicted MFS family arabinose efflux permease